VESPAKARTIGRYLGSAYTVKSSVGHVRDLLKSRLSVDLENDFEPEYRVPNDKRKVVKELAAAAEKATEIFLATDPDREGEAIAWHVLESAEMEPERTRRVVFQEITKNAILKAFENPRDIDMKRVDAQQARRILDRLVGYKLSPLLWRKVRGRLSAGRVQSVAVRLVVEREREIDAFVADEYWHIKAELQQQKKGASSFEARLHRYQDEEPVLQSEADVLPHLDILEKAVWQVGEVRLGTRSRKPSAPYTTSTLQQEASRRINFRTKKTMRIAQQLYEGIDLGDGEAAGLITYMRTDSVNVSKDAQDAARDYIAKAFGAEYRPESPPSYKTKSKTAQEAHEAIRPTDAHRTPGSVKSALSRDQYRLYQLIWSRFIASQMAPAEYDTVSTDIYAGEANTSILERPYLFRATGSTLRFKGFLAIYEESRGEDDEDEDESQVPADLTAEALLDLLQLLPEQHFTKAPPRFSEATLVRELEDNGIGRPSTYSSIISTILDRGYVAGEDRRLVPTETGNVVTDLLVEFFPDVLSTDFTARMEDELDEIAQGRADWVPVIKEFYAPFSRRLAHAEEKMPKRDLQKEVEYVGRECPLCGNPLVYRDGRYGRFIGCSDFPKCRHTEQIIVKAGVTCPVNGGEIVERRTRRGRVFFGCSHYPQCEWRSWTKPVSNQNDNCEGVLVEVKNDDQPHCIECAYKAEDASANGQPKEAAEATT
jgi:DNA topoisomerase-1